MDGNLKNGFMVNGLMHKFKNITLIGRLESSAAIESLNLLTDYLIARQISVSLEEGLAQGFSNPDLPIVASDKIGKSCDLAIVVGGDGSMLSAARIVAGQHVPVLGVNRGRLGFLTDILPDQIEEKVEEVLQGRYLEEKRFLLEAAIIRKDKLITKADALNDVVINSGQTARMIEFELYVDEQFVYSQRSDGLIISTPTGSTAYALSAGGPILHPKLDALVLVPMFPHSLSNRPIVIDGNSNIQVVLGDLHDMQADVSCDGHEIHSVDPGDVVSISKKPDELTLLHPIDTNFYETCRDKLRWGDRLDA